MIRSLSVLVATSIILIVSSSIVAADTNKMDQALQETLRSGSVTLKLPVIVQTAAPVCADHRAGFRDLGGTVGTEFVSVQGFAGTIPSERLAELASRSWVSRLSHDGGVRKMLDTAAPAIGAGAAWGMYGVTGQGVGVAVIDSGIADHSDFVRLGPDGTPVGSRIVAVQDWCSTSEGGWGADACGHGTNVAGTIGGNGINSTNVDPDDPEFYRTFTGLAPEANLVNCRVLDGDGTGMVSDVIEAIEWCVERRDQYNIRVMNLSLGRPVGESFETDPLCQACEYAWFEGIVVVTSAGNIGYEGYSTILSPGNDPYVITVGAVNDMGTADRSDDEICGYSSRGPSPIDHVLKPDLVAPGNQIAAVRHRNSQLEQTHAYTNVVAPEYYMIDYGGKDRNNTKRGVKDSEYFVLSGTSMASAVTAGACALMVEADPSLTPDDIKTRLMLTAEKSGQYGPLWQGAGYLTVDEALDCPVYAGSAARSPYILEYGEGYAMYPAPVLVDGENLVWEPQIPGGHQSNSDYGVPAFPVWGWLDSDNLVWEPQLPPMGSDLDAYLVLVPDQPVYPPEPCGEQYQPGMDDWWAGYEGFPGWPQGACSIDVSEVAVYGEEQAEYLGLHGRGLGKQKGGGGRGHGNGKGRGRHGDRDEDEDKGKHGDEDEDGDKGKHGDEDEDGDKGKGRGKGKHGDRDDDEDKGKGRGKGKHGDRDDDEHEDEDRD